MVPHRCVDDSGVTKRTILPSSHTGGCRYFMKNFQDGLAICRVHGALDLVSTFASNAKGPEITKALLLEPGQQPCDIRAGCISGHVKAVYAVKFQKRGLSHAHLLFWRDVDMNHRSAIDKESMSTTPARYEETIDVSKASSLEGGNTGMEKKRQDLGLRRYYCLRSGQTMHTVVLDEPHTNRTFGQWRLDLFCLYIEYVSDRP